MAYHGNVIVALNNLSDFSHFVLHIPCPDLTDYLTGICKCGRHVGRSKRAEDASNPAALHKGPNGRQNDEQGQPWKRMANKKSMNAFNCHRNNDQKIPHKQDFMIVQLLLLLLYYYIIFYRVTERTTLN